MYSNFIKAYALWDTLHVHLTILITWISFSCATIFNLKKISRIRIMLKNLHKVFTEYSSTRVCNKISRIEWYWLLLTLYIKI